MRRDWFANAVLGVMCVCALVVTSLAMRRSLFSATPIANHAKVKEWSSYGGVGHRSGGAQARVVIVDFADYECPYCRQAIFRLDSLINRYPLEVALVERHFPLEGLHPSAFAAAVAAECAHDQGKFVEFRNALYGAQDSIRTWDMAHFGRLAGIQDSAAFKRCLTSGGPASRVRADMAAGNRLGISGTPTILVNGVRIDGAPSSGELDSLVNAALQRGSNAL